jgi:hypothetical protein
MPGTGIPAADGTLAAIKIIGDVSDAIKKCLPRWEEEVSATVYGGPTSTRKSLYRLAMALVWGKIQRRDFIRILPPAGFLKLEYNLEEKSVNVTCRMVTTYLPALLGLIRTARSYELFQGPAETAVGGEWAFTSILPGLPGSPGIDLKNGFENRVLITPNAAYNDATGTVRVSRSPTPPGDRISRGYATVARSPAATLGDPANWNNTPDFLLWAALSEPCGAKNLNQPVYSPTPLGYYPIPSPGLPPTGTTLTGSPSPYAPPDPTVTTPPGPLPTAPLPHDIVSENPTVPYSTPPINDLGLPIRPPGFPPGIPIFDGSPNQG